MENPYIFRGPVNDPTMFFGRKHEMDEIAAFLRGNQSISIVGPRKIGKTSLLFHLMRPTSWPDLGISDDILFAYLDCEVLGESDHGEILAQFGGEIAAALDERGLPPHGSQPAQVLRRKGQGTRPRARRTRRPSTALPEQPQPTQVDASHQGHPNACPGQVAAPLADQCTQAAPVG